MENKKKNILSKEEFITIINTRMMAYVTEEPIKPILINSYAAALERITELDKQLIEAKKLTDHNSEFQIEVQNIIYDLESRLAIYEPLDTKEEAKKKLNKQINDFVNREIDFEVQYTKGEFFIAAQDWPDNQIKPESFKFKYKVPREIKPGDLIEFSSHCNEIMFILGKPIDYRKDELVSVKGNWYPKNSCKPTGYRKDENGKLVPIK